MNTRSKTLDWTFWFYWIMATSIGWIIGKLFFSNFPIILSGIGVSALQWAVLYGRIHKAWRWGILSSIGWISGYILFVVIFSSSSSILLGTFLGITVGIPQWLILKREVEWAGWWVIISALAWNTGLTIMPGLLTSGALPGALTGLTLVILFRFSPSKEPERKNQILPKK